VQTSVPADFGGTRRLRRIAANYRYLQGLMMLPFVPVLIALFVLELFLPNSGPLRSPTTLAILEAAFTTLVVLGTGAGIGAILISRHYRRRFGRATPSLRARLAGGIVGGLGALGFNYTVDSTLFSVQYIPLGPVNTGMLLMAAAWGVYWFLTGRFLTHYLVLAVIGVVVGLLPLLGFVPPGRWWDLREVTLYLALIALIGGYLDHRTLVKGLAPATTPA
jgi:hypothetical protein